MKIDYVTEQATMMDQLLTAVEASDKDKAFAHFRTATEKGYKAWDVHLALFPIVQQVLNPPYINPHLPKMYGVCRKFIPYLEPEEIEPLVRLELTEYTRRSKLGRASVGRPVKRNIPFDEIEAAIRGEDQGRTVALLSAFHERQGAKELARRLLLLGSSYIDQSIGHSISCTTFILLEMLKRVDQDPLPSLFALAYYFCKGHFYTTPPLTTAVSPFSEDALAREVLRASSGTGFVNIHHTITLYAIEQASHLLTDDEHQKLLAACAAFMDGKEIRKVDPGPKDTPTADYAQFYGVLSSLEVIPAVKSFIGLTGSENGRRLLGRFLIKGVCDLYDGAYDPHYLTGLGATLWAVNRFPGNRKIAANVLYQYFDFFFSGLKSKK
jgi:hypothetical protein